MQQDIRSSPSVLILQHVACEGPGVIADALRAKTIDPRIVRIDRAEAIPSSLDAFAGLVVMGGPMGVYEANRFPHLTAEVRLLEDALSAGRPVLGVCLGSQLLAACLGFPVRPAGVMEIGWHDVRLLQAASTDILWQGVAATFPAFHWHGDVFALPRGAVALASSAMTECQAFRFGKNAYGLLFHLEVESAQVETMVRVFAGDLSAAGRDPQSILHGLGDRVAQAHSIGQIVFGRWADLVLEWSGLSWRPLS